MAVLTGTTITNQSPLGNGDFADVTYKDWSKQVPFTDKSLALPYYTWRKKVFSQKIENTTMKVGASTVVWGSDFGPIESMVSTAIGSSPNSVKVSYNRAYSKFMEQVKQGNADMMALVMERASAGQMIADRFTQILRIAEACDKKNWKALARSLGTSVTDLKRRHARTTGFLSTPSTTFLEVYWGWMPLLQDAANALVYLGREIPPLRVSASSGFPINAEKTSGSPSTQYGSYSVWECNGEFRLKVGGVISLQSALQSELSRLGITNVAASLWEVTPYSWLFDWFTSIGQAIETFDDNLQFKLGNVYITRLIRYGETHRFEDRWGTNPVRVIDYVRHGSYMRRETPRNLPSAFLTVFPPNLSVLRVASVAALLALKMKRFKRLASSLF